MQAVNSPATTHADRVLRRAVDGRDLYGGRARQRRIRPPHGMMAYRHPDALCPQVIDTLVTENSIALSARPADQGRRRCRCRFSIPGPACCRPREFQRWCDRTDQATHCRRACARCQSILISRRSSAFRVAPGRGNRPAYVDGNRRRMRSVSTGRRSRRSRFGDAHAAKPRRSRCKAISIRWR